MDVLNIPLGFPRKKEVCSETRKYLNKFYEHKFSRLFVKGNPRTIFEFIILVKKSKIQALLSMGILQKLGLLLFKYNKICI